MDVLWFLKFVVFTIVAGTLLQRLLDKLWKRLPGPIGIPVLGRLPWVIFNAVSRHNGNFYEAVACDGLTHGDARFLRIGMREIVVLSSADSIHEALVKQGDEFADRPSNDYFIKYRRVEILTDGKRSAHCGGIGFSNGDLWKEHRRFALRVLRDFGMGKDLIQNNIQVEINGLTDLLSSTSKQAFNPNMCLTKAVSNIICQLVFGYRLAYEDPEFDQHIRIIKEFTTSFGFADFLPIFFPFLENDLYFKFSSADRFLEIDKKILEYISTKVQEVEDNYKEDAEPTNYIEAYLRERETLSSDESQASFYSRKQLVVSVADLFLAGTDTTSNALNWAFIYMAAFKDWQTKVHDELDRELGSCAQVSYIDRLRCPVTQAVMDEVMRHCSLVPHNLDKALLKETWFRDCRISPDTFLIADIKSAHYDPQVWPEPQRFDPSRFLHDDGIYKPSKKLLTFSTGKRSCLGESLARMEYFLFFSSVMQKFEVDMDEETRLKGENIFLGTDGDVHAPKEHGLIFRERLINL